MSPHRFPRVPHLFATTGTTVDDRVVDEATRRRFLTRPVVVEEKLDGANGMLWMQEHRVSAAGRGGQGGLDRGRQMGRLRAWAAERDAALRALLHGGRVLYGEWLWRPHTVHYDRLPDLFIAFDVWSEDRGFLHVEERDAALVGHGLFGPPKLFRGVLNDRQTVESLFGPSRVGSEPMEGVVLRHEPRHGRVERAKLLNVRSTPARVAAHPGASFESR